MPQSSIVLRLPGSDFSAERNSLLPKQPNCSLSIGRASPSSDAISGTVGPRPSAYCVVTSTGNFENASCPNQQLRVLDQLILVEDGRQQLLLNVDDDQCALIGHQRLARHIGGIGWKGSPVTSWIHVDRMCAHLDATVLLIAIARLIDSLVGTISLC